MAEARTFPFTACIDHLNTTYEDLHSNWLAANRNFQPRRSSAFRELVTLSATTCNFKSEKSLEERQADVARIREKHPDRIPVIILQAQESRIRYPNRQKLLISANRNLATFFISIWNIFYKYEYRFKTYSLRSVVEHKDPIFEKLMSLVYDEYKDEDGCLYITLSGRMRPLIHQPIRSNINTWTYYDLDIQSN